MIKVRIRYAGHSLFEGVDDGDVVEVEAGCTVADLLTRLGVEARFLDYVVPFVNDRPRERDHVLEDGDELRPFVPVSGG